MTKNENKTFFYINLLITFEGILYLFFKYFMKTETEYGLRPHEYTAHLLHLHILLVPSLLVAFGYFLKIHVVDKIKSENIKKKRSGYSLVSFFLIMTLSGYLIQVIADISSIKLIGLIHIIVSLLWFTMLVWHRRKR